MKNATNELQILVLVLDAAHMVSRGAPVFLCCICICIFVIIIILHLAGGNKSHVCQGKQKCLLSKLDICTAKFDVCSIPFVFSTLEH